MDLDIVEPPVQVEESPPVKRALRYEIKIDASVSPTVGADVDRPPSPPPHLDSDQGRRRRRQPAADAPASAALGSGARGDAHGVLCISDWALVR